ncbi:lipid droplet assembly factor 1 [Gammaproteobacteria bacterium]|nr:lipid droplet assembly factor 1 [Gammaproteobacteria bacterium]
MKKSYALTLSPYEVAERMYNKPYNLDTKEVDCLLKELLKDSSDARKTELDVDSGKKDNREVVEVKKNYSYLPGINSESGSKNCHPSIRPHAVCENARRQFSGWYEKTYNKQSLFNYIWLNIDDKSLYEVTSEQEINHQDLQDTQAKSEKEAEQSLGIEFCVFLAFLSTIPILIFAIYCLSLVSVTVFLLELTVCFIWFLFMIFALQFNGICISLDKTHQPFNDIWPCEANKKNVIRANIMEYVRSAEPYGNYLRDIDDFIKSINQKNNMDNKSTKLYQDAPCLSDLDNLVKDFKTRSFVLSDHVPLSINYIGDFHQQFMSTEQQDYRFLHPYQIDNNHWITLCIDAKKSDLGQKLSFDIRVINPFGGRHDLEPQMKKAFESHIRDYDANISYEFNYHVESYPKFQQDSNTCGVWTIWMIKQLADHQLKSQFNPIVDCITNFHSTLSSELETSGYQTLDELIREKNLLRMPKEDQEKFQTKLSCS